MRLSILICTLKARRDLFKRLLDRLLPQRDAAGGEAIVEVVAAGDNGELAIGAKRNRLVATAKGDYVCFVDDDDLVADDYVAKILKAVETSPDCVGIEGIITFDGKNPKKFIHTVKCQQWEERDGVYWRTPNHLNPIRREIVLQVPFPEIDHGEDHDFSKRVRPLLSSEVYVDGPIYHYLYQQKKG